MPSDDDPHLLTAADLRRLPAPADTPADCGCAGLKAPGWESIMIQVRQNLELDGALRELMIMRIAHLNGPPTKPNSKLPSR